MAVAVGVDCTGHGGVGGRVVEQAVGLCDDPGPVGPHEPDRAGVDPLGAFGGLAEHEDGLAQAGALLLGGPRSR